MILTRSAVARTASRYPSAIRAGFSSQCRSSHLVAEAIIETYRCDWIAAHTMSICGATLAWNMTRPLLPIWPVTCRTLQ